MNKPFPLLCLDCKYSEADPNSNWSHKCFHPKVVANNAWALSSNFEGKPYGVSCQGERKKRSWFAPCGMRGKLWEPKNDD